MKLGQSLSLVLSKKTEKERPGSANIHFTPDSEIFLASTLWEPWPPGVTSIDFHLLGALSEMASRAAWLAFPLALILRALYQDLKMKANQGKDEGRVALAGSAAGALWGLSLATQVPEGSCRCSRKRVR